MVIIQLKFDDFTASHFPYQPYCRFNIYTNDIFNIREEVQMRLLFFPSHRDLGKDRGDEILCWICPIENTTILSDPTSSGLGGGVSWSFFGADQNTVPYVILPDESVLHQYGELIQYRMTETRTDGVRTLADKMET